jgi:hypothetical protein
MLDRFDAVRPRNSIYEELGLAGFNDGQHSTLDTRKAVDVFRRPDVKSMYKSLRIVDYHSITSSTPSSAFTFKPHLTRFFSIHLRESSSCVYHFGLPS